MEKENSNSEKKIGPFWTPFWSKNRPFLDKNPFFGHFFKMAHQRCLQLGQGTALNYFVVVLCLGIVLFWLLFNKFWKKYIACGDKMILLVLFDYFFPICSCSMVMCCFLTITMVYSWNCIFVDQLTLCTPKKFCAKRISPYGFSRGHMAPHTIGWVDNC